MFNLISLIVHQNRILKTVLRFCRFIFQSELWNFENFDETYFLTISKLSLFGGHTLSHFTSKMSSMHPDFVDTNCVINWRLERIASGIRQLWRISRKPSTWPSSLRKYWTDAPQNVSLIHYKWFPLASKHNFVYIHFLRFRKFHMTTEMSGHWPKKLSNLLLLLFKNWNQWNFIIFSRQSARYI